MGRIATNISDFTIVTEDNSRSEDTDSIIADISAGIASNNFVIIKDRRKAIFFALETATNGDTVLLAGKGHEDYTIIGKEKRHFSEKEVIKEYYKEKYKKNI
jgi:UDP-N-acetylmuramoyl-L-alanyl-D-glutamate--2,6-diaminopimelate ligase